MSLSFLSPPDKGRAESSLPGLFRSPFLRGSGGDPEWEQSGDGGEQGMEALSPGTFPRAARLSSCAGHGRDHERVVPFPGRKDGRRIFFLDLIFRLV